jgi:hypothetical protein
MEFRKAKRKWPHPSALYFLATFRKPRALRTRSAATKAGYARSEIQGYLDSFGAMRLARFKSIFARNKFRAPKPIGLGWDQGPMQRHGRR